MQQIRQILKRLGRPRVLARNPAHYRATTPDQIECDPRLIALADQCR